MKTEERDPAPGLSREETRAIDHAIGALDWRRSDRMEEAMSRDPRLDAEVGAWREVYGLLADVCDRVPPGMERVASLEIPRVRPEPFGRRFARTVGPRVAPLTSPVVRALATPRRAALAGAGIALAAVCGLAFLRANFAPPVHTPPAAASPSLMLNGAVQAAVAEGARCEFVAVDRIVLSEGAVWLSVKPGGRGLRVTTPHGEARVLGTQFGVAVDESGMRVDVVEGRVAVEDSSGRDAEVPAGARATVSAEEGLGAVEDRPEGEALPPWVLALVEQQRATWFASHFPSIGVHQSK